MPSRASQLPVSSLRAARLIHVRLTGSGVAALVFFWFKLPETKGRALEQSEQEVHGGSEAG